MSARNLVILAFSLSLSLFLSLVSQGLCGCAWLGQTIFRNSDEVVLAKRNRNMKERTGRVVAVLAILEIHVWSMARRALCLAI